MKANLNLNKNATALTRVDHSARMDRVEALLDDRAVQLKQLNPQQLAEHREFGLRTLDAIDGVRNFLPGGGIIGPGGLNPVPSTPEGREKDLEDLIKEKTDPEFAAKKKAERTAKRLGSLFSSKPIIFNFPGHRMPTENDDLKPRPFAGGLGGLFPNPVDRGVAHKHNTDKAIINLIYSLEGKELELVKTEFEKTQGKTLEGAVLERFRGDVQQSILKHVRGGGAEAEGEKKADTEPKPAPKAAE